MRSTASATRAGSSASSGLGVAGVDEAEPAGPRAALAVDHEGGGAVGPALEDVRAAGLLAHGDEVEVAHRAACSAGTSSPMRTRAAAHVGLRSSIDRPSVTPAAASRPDEPHRLAARPAPRREGREVRAVGGVAPGDVLARSTALAAATSSTDRATTASTTSRIERVDALGGQRRDRLVGDAARHDVVEYARSGSTLRAKPCIERPRRCARRWRRSCGGRRSRGRPRRPGSRRAGRRRAGRGRRGRR